MSPKLDPAEQLGAVRERIRVLLLEHDQLFRALAGHAREEAELLGRLGREGDALPQRRAGALSSALADYLNGRYYERQLESGFGPLTNEQWEALKP